MACTVFKGRDFTLLGQFNDPTGSYGNLPAAVKSTRLKFSDLSLDRKPIRQQDPTIDNNVLMQKTDEVDESPDGSITAIACINEMRYWMQAMFGVPTTTGAGPYTHTFTMANDCKPDMVLELDGLLPATSTNRIRRFVGAMVKDLTWDILADAQNITLSLLMAREIRPFPTAVYDSAPTKITKARALAARGSVFDVANGNTLGKIDGATLKIDLGLLPKKLADGNNGYGIVLPGQISFSGTISVLYENGGMADYAELQTTRPITITSQAKTGETVTFTFPSVEFSEPANEVKTTQGIVRTYNWMAHANVGDPPVTCVLVNAVASL